MPAQVEPVTNNRPPRLVDRRTAIEKAEGWARKQLQGNLRRLVELARGVYAVGPAPKGQRPRYLVLRDPESGHEEVIGFGIVVYKTVPNLAALQYLVDRGMGKVPTRVEITGADEGPVQFMPWRPELVAAVEVDYIEGELVEGHRSEGDAGEEEGSKGQEASRTGRDPTTEPEDPISA